ncbi:hypothetical protein ABPG75_003172 [Micractinium tetrahymenae]
MLLHVPGLHAVCESCWESAALQSADAGGLVCPRCWREAAAGPPADVAWVLWRKNQTNRWRYVPSLKDAAPLFPARDAMQALRLELEGGGWTPRAVSALQDMLLLARAALLHGHARRLAMRAEFHATGSRSWLAERQRSMAQQEARLRRLAEGGKGGSGGGAGAEAEAACRRPLVLTAAEAEHLRLVLLAELPCRSSGLGGAADWSPAPPRLLGGIVQALLFAGQARYAAEQAGEEWSWQQWWQQGIASVAWSTALPGLPMIEPAAQEDAMLPATSSPRPVRARRSDEQRALPVNRNLREAFEAVCASPDGLPERAKLAAEATTGTTARASVSAAAGAQRQQQQQQQQAEPAVQSQPAPADHHHHHQQRQQTRPADPSFASRKVSAAERRRRHPRRQPGRPQRLEEPTALQVSSLPAAPSAAAGEAAAPGEPMPLLQSSSGQPNAEEGQPAAAAAAAAGKEGAPCKAAGTRSAGDQEPLFNQAALAVLPTEQQAARIATALPLVAPPTPEPAAVLPPAAVPPAALDAAPVDAAAMTTESDRSAAAEKAASAARCAAGRLASVSSAQSAASAARAAHAPAVVPGRSVQRALALAAAILCTILSILLARMLPAEAWLRL